MTIHTNNENVKASMYLLNNIDTEYIFRNTHHPLYMFLTTHSWNVDNIISILRAKRKLRNLCNQIKDPYTKVVGIGIVSFKYREPECRHYGERVLLVLCFVFDKQNKKTTLLKKLGEQLFDINLKDEIEEYLYYTSYFINIDNAMHLTEEQKFEEIRSIVRSQIREGENFPGPISPVMPIVKISI